MAVSTFDTLNAMRGLEAAGIHPKQAEANAVRDAVMEGTATKGDILRVDNDIKTGFTSVNGKVDALATETRADIKQLDGKIDALATETRAEFERLSDKIDSLATKATVDALATETRAEFERLSDKIEPLATKAMVDAGCRPRIVNSENLQCIDFQRLFRSELRRFKAEIGNFVTKRRSGRGFWPASCVCGMP